MRRVFLSNREIPAILGGVVRGDPAALRRVLGARRGGRVGVAIGLVGLLLAAPTDLWPWLAAAQIAIGVPGAALARPQLSWLEYERLSLWLAGAALIAVTPLRWLPPPAPLLIFVAWAGAHLWLWGHLRRGFGDLPAS